MTVTTDICPRCGAEVMTSNYDVLTEVTSSIMVDPTPLQRMEVAACIIAGRPLYRYEEAAGGALGLAVWATADRKMGKPDASLPKHQCGGRFASGLPKVVIVERGEVAPF